MMSVWCYITNALCPYSKPLKPNGSGKHKEERNSVAKALTGREALTLKAAIEAGPDQWQSCILFAVSQLDVTRKAEGFLTSLCSTPSSFSFASAEASVTWAQARTSLNTHTKKRRKPCLVGHCVVTLSMEIPMMKAIYASLSYLVVCIHI